MIVRVLLGLACLIALTSLWFHAIGKGWVGGGPWESSPVADGPRPIAVPGDGSPEARMPEARTPEARTPEARTPQILFGDLHTHTNYSIDAYLFNTELVKGTGVVTPADACDFARYCAALDYWSINDHAESLTPRAWADTVESIRQCNAGAGNPSSPDMVSFVGWEWTNSERDDVPSHYGHKNVIFRTWEEGSTPTRPIASHPVYVVARVPALLRGLISLADTLKAASDFGWYVSEAKRIPICPDGVAADELPDDCREVAATPRDLYRKLDEWGLDALVIPHGLAWGTTNPLAADFRDQLDQYELRYQKLLETYSGHGNSEVFEDFQRIGVDDQGERFCPEATANFTPCCRQAAAIARTRCDAPDSAACDNTAARAMASFVDKGAPAGRGIFPDATLDDWAGCGQLRNSFQPASMYVPRQSTQYTLALGFDEYGNPKRTKFGLIGSSDNHLARPGNSYKETDRLLYTDSKSFGGEPVWSLTEDIESGSFYYTGGLVAVHSAGRDRDAIWQALRERRVYATSGDRMLVWFDLLNGPQGTAPMGSEVAMGEAPRFRVRALGAFEQRSGCPDYAVAGLGSQRIASLCGGECYRPGDRRKAITRIEIVRIRPQISAGEPVAPLIEHRWRVFDCPGDGTGCNVKFEDPDYVVGRRSALYYARVIQEPQPLIGGDPFGCVEDGEGNCVRYNYCVGENAARENNCRSPAQPRAWTSPIFVEFPAVQE